MMDGPTDQQTDRTIVLSLLPETKKTNQGLVFETKVGSFVV